MWLISFLKWLFGGIAQDPERVRREDEDDLEDDEDDEDDEAPPY